MRWLIFASLLLLLAGASCIGYSRYFPVYTEPGAPSRIQDEIDALPQEVRLKEWFSRLRAVETPHKKYDDLGRGLCAAGAGLLTAAWLWSLYHRLPGMRRPGVLIALWWALCLIRTPFSIWYYFLRLLRQDYPTWADSIAIPIFSEAIGMLFSAVVGWIVLRLLLKSRVLTPSIRFARPQSGGGWVRTCFIGCWMLLRAACIVLGIPDGNEGVVFTSFAAIVILSAFLAATPHAVVDPHAPSVAPA